MSCSKEDDDNNNHRNILTETLGHSHLKLKPNLFLNGTQKCQVIEISSTNSKFGLHKLKPTDSKMMWSSGSI